MRRGRHVTTSAATNQWRTGGKQLAAHSLPNADTALSSNKIVMFISLSLIFHRCDDSQTLVDNNIVLD